MLGVDNPTPKAVLTGHQSPVTSVVVSAELGIIVSGSQGSNLKPIFLLCQVDRDSPRYLRCCRIDGALLIHSNTGDLLRSLEPVQLDTNKALLASRPICMSMNREGYIVVNFASGALCLFGVNGKCLRVVTHNDGIQVRKTFK